MSCYFLPIVTPLPLSHFVTHPGIPQKYVTHLGPPIFSRPSTKTRTKTLCTNSLSIVRGAFSRGFSLEGFVRGDFCLFPFGQNTSDSYKRKLNITLNFRFHIYDKKIYKCDVTSSRPPSPVTNCHTISDPLPSSVTYFMDGPIST